MDVQLQELIDKIKKDGVAAAEKDAAKIIADSEKKAEAIIEEAQSKAADIIKSAKSETKKMEKAARDTCCLFFMNNLTFSAEIPSIFCNFAAHIH